MLRNNGGLFRGGEPAVYEVPKGGGGMYLVHVEVKGLGLHVIKFAAVKKSAR